MKVSRLYSNFRLRVTGRAYSAADYAYYSQKRVYNQMLAPRLTPDMFLRKVDNSKQQELTESLCALANKRREGQLVNDARIEEIKSFIADNMQHMTTQFLDRMEQVTIAAGLFVLAYAIRELNEELVMRLWAGGETKHGDCPAVLFITKVFWCCLNRSDYDGAGDLLSHPDICGNSGMAEHVRSLCRAFGLIERDTAEGRKTPEDAAFADYVKDRNIAIIGPSPSGNDYSEEVTRDFDIVIRMNYRGSDKLPEAERGVRVHAAYYRDRTGPWKKAKPDENTDYLAGLDFAVLRGTDKKTHRKIRQYTNVRTANAHSQLFFLPTKPNVMQLILYDLSFFEPARIKIFNANFFLADTLWYKGYKEESKNFISLWHGKAIHNYVCQYQYARHLFLRGLTEADKRLTEVLELGTKEYVRQIELQENQREI